MAASLDMLSTPGAVCEREMRSGIVDLQEDIVDARAGGRKGCFASCGDCGGVSILSREELEPLEDTGEFSEGAEGMVARCGARRAKTDICVPWPP
jgi:hypothetical protein